MTSKPEPAKTKTVHLVTAAAVHVHYPPTGKKEVRTYQRGQAIPNYVDAPQLQKLVEKGLVRRLDLPVDTTTEGNDQ